MRIRTRLLTLVVATLLPASIAGVIGIATVYENARSATSQSMLETARALARLIENEIDASRVALDTLAQSPALQFNEMDRVRDYVQRVSQQRKSLISVSDAQGRLLLNTGTQAFPPDHHLITGFSRDDHGEPGARRVSPLYWSGQLNQLAVAVRAPVFKNGQLAYVLQMEMPVSHVQALLEKQKLPSAWIGSILDNQGVIVARTRQPDRFVGETATGPIRARIERAEEGSNEGTAMSGEPVFAFFSRMPQSGWTLVVSVPQQALRGPAVRAASLTGLTLLLILGLGVLAAWGISRRVAQPIESLRVAAEAMGRGEPVRPPRSGLLELDAVANELEHASVAIRGAQGELREKVEQAVAENERAQKALLQAQKMEALGRLTGGIAHDFNNVLQTLTSGLQIMQIQAADERTKSVLQTCESAVDRAVDLVRQLMAFARVQESRQVTIDPVQRLRAMQPLLHGVLPRHVEFSFDAPDGIWPVTLDPLQFELAVLNLAINARDAMPSGGTLRIGLANRTLDAPHPPLEAGDFVLLTISDTGLGMSPEVAGRALDPFFTTKEAGMGTGLGLAQAYAFVRQSGGDLHIDSAPERGTTMSIYLPRSSLPIDGATALPDAVPRPPAAAEGRILFVEDDPLVREVVATSLQSAGFEVVTARSGDEALQRLSGERFDLVFSDVVMPGSTNGVGLANIVRRDFPGTQIVLATGYSHEPIAVQGVRVLAKPYDVQTLPDILLSEIRGARARPTERV